MAVLMRRVGGSERLIRHGAWFAASVHVTDICTRRMIFSQIVPPL